MKKRALIYGVLALFVAAGLYYVIAGRQAPTGLTTGESTDTYDAEEGAIPEADELRFMPDIEFHAEPASVPVGESVLLRWNVEGADEVIFVESPFLPVDPEFNLEEIIETGERLNHSYEMALNPVETTAYYIIARNEDGLNMECRIVDVFENVPEEPAPGEWIDGGDKFIRPDDATYSRELEQGAAPDHDGLVPDADMSKLEQVMGQFLFFGPGGGGGGGLGGPAVKITKVEPVNKVFYAKQEYARVYWNITNAKQYVTSGSYYGIELVADKKYISGRKFGGVSMGGGAGIMGPLPGSTGSFSSSGYHGVHKFTVTAVNAKGKSAGSSAKCDAISVPLFTGNGVTQGRKNEIKKAIKNIYVKLSTDYAGLDKKVTAFKKGYINRKKLWGDLKLEIQNLDITTFSLEKKPSNWNAVGRWGEHSNVIYIYYIENFSQQIWYERLVLHELLHKCGFNNDLVYGKGMSKSEVEDDIDAITSTLFPS